LQTVGGAALTTHETVDTDGAASDGTPAGPPPASVDPGRRARANRLFIAVALAIIAADLVAKQLTVSILAHRDSVRLLGGAVYLLHVRNSGAAFSLGQGYTFIFPIVACVVVAWIIWMSRRVTSLSWAVALGLVLGGALGNLGDRIFRAPGPFVGHVVDMISVFADGGQRFPVFNVADSALSVGVVLAVLLEFTGRRRDGSRVVKDVGKDDVVKNAEDSDARE
jgi:signal peptidase II